MTGGIVSLAILAGLLGLGIGMVHAAIHPEADDEDEGEGWPDWDQPLPPRRPPHTPRPHYPTGAGNAWHRKQQQRPEGEQ